MRARSAVVFGVLRLLALLVPFGLMMLFPVMREYYWLSAIFAALIGLSWADAKFGIDHGFCTATDFSDIAFPTLSGDSPDQEDVVRLYLAEDEAAKRTVVEQVCKRKEPDDELSVRKWIFLELQSIRARNGENIGRTLDEVESLYADLDYPPTLARFVRYMPAAPEDIASGNVGENRMVEKLDEFLEKEKSELAEVSK